MAAWPPEAVEILKTLWMIEGKTARQISVDLGERGYRFSRNAVIGEIHRLEISGSKAGGNKRTCRPKGAKAASAKPKPKPKPTMATKPKPPTFLAEPVLDVALALNPWDRDHQPVEYLKLQPHHCRCLLGGTKGSDGLPLSCGRNKVKLTPGPHGITRESSYCPGHDRIFHVRAERDYA